MWLVVLEAGVALLSMGAEGWMSPCAPRTCSRTLWGCLVVEVCAHRGGGRDAHIGISALNS